MTIVINIPFLAKKKENQYELSQGRSITFLGMRFTWNR